MSLTDETKVVFWKKLGFTNISDLRILQENEEMEEIIEGIEDNEFKALKKALKKQLKPHLSTIKEFVKTNKREKKIEKQREKDRKEIEEYQRARDVIIPPPQSTSSEPIRRVPPPPPIDDGHESDFIEEETDPQFDNVANDYNRIKRLENLDEMISAISSIVYQQLHAYPDELESLFQEIREKFGV